MAPAQAQSVTGTGEVLFGTIQTPDWVVGGDLVVGDSAAGTLTIDAGGTVSNDWAYIGNFNGGVGTIIVSGSDGGGQASTWTTSGQAYIGTESGSNGTLGVLGGGSARSEWAVLGRDAGSVGVATVSGVGSTWTISSGVFLIGSGGSGTLQIDDGGAVRSSQALIGWEVGSDGIVAVSGPTTAWEALNNIYVGFDGEGELTVLDGATVSTAGSSAPGAAATLYIGLNPGSIGTVTVSGSTAENATLTTSDRVEVGTRGTGTLTIGKGGWVGADSDTWIAIAGSATGTLNLTGDASGRGVLETGSVISGAGNASLNLNGGILRANRHEPDFLNGFAAQAVGSEGAGFDTNTYDVGIGTAFSGTSRFDKLGAGTLTLTGDSSAFTGITDIQAGALQIDGILGGPADVFAGARLTGIGRIGPTVNHGTIAPGPRSGFGTLTIAGDYAAQGGGLAVRTRLGGDDSPTDKLVVTGATSGTTPVTVTNMGGTGARTQRGIQLVEVQGVSAGQFDLANGDYVIAGQQALVAGAYAYVLQQDADDGGWYLRSSLTDAPGSPVPGDGGGTPGTEGSLRYQPGVPVYEAYANTLLSLSQLPTLRQRVGNRHYGPAGAGRHGVWGRVEGSTSHFDPSVSATGQRHDIDSWKAQFGVDRILAGEEGGSRLVGGLTVHYGTADTYVSSAHGNGGVDTTAYGLGPTLTWYGQDGTYVDVQAQATWFDSDLDSSAAGKLKGGQDARSYGISLEAGRALPLRDGLQLIPQVQLGYVSTRFGGFDDRFGAPVDDEKGDSLQGRFGIALDYRSRWQDARGRTHDTSVYGVLNVKHEFLDGTRVRVGGVPVGSRMGRTWGGVGLGANVGWDERHAFYGEVAADTDFTGSHIVTATAGYRMSF